MPRVVAIPTPSCASSADELSDETADIELLENVCCNFRLSRIFVGAREPCPAAGVAPDRVLRIPYPSRAQRAQCWQAELAALGLGAPPDTLLSRLAGGFLLTEAQIARAALAAKARRSSDTRWGEDAFIEAARAQAKTGLGALAHPETCSFGLDRLVLDEPTRLLLQELIDYARHREAMLRGWGFADVLEKGLGLTALFVGPPGTGKSLAATAIARELGLELYRVDLSQLVSKYIGETEKHLAELFDAAEQGEVMLLFDEADAIFGKRTEVKSSVDRYANLEVNYLLQRIERFGGLVVLTTNHEKGIDDAFARRIRFRVLFDAPDEHARLRLWQHLLGPRVPLSAGVDLSALASRYELSGGHIKEVILRAAARAFAEAREVAQEDLERSAEAEYRKLGLLSPLAARRVSIS